MLNKLKSWLIPNSVTKDPNDKILLLDSAGSVGIQKIHEEMRLEDTGLREETIVHVTSLFLRVTARLLMNGYNVNTGLFYAVPRLTGVVEGGKWNPAKNSIYVSFTQDKILREEIKNTEVVILGEKADSMYILEVEDRKTKLKDGTITPGRNMFVRGACLKVEGEDPAVGVTFTNKETQAVVKLDDDLITVNNPSELTLLVPTDLANGDYELTVCTQYMKGSAALLKSPRSVSVSVSVSGSENERPDEV